MALPEKLLLAWLPTWKAGSYEEKSTWCDNFLLSIPEHQQLTMSKVCFPFFTKFWAIYLILSNSTNKDAQAKILNEFSKRIDPDLKFYYWTGAKHRYNEFDLPSFNRPTKEGAIERLDKVRLSRRGDPGIFVANRASLPQKGQLTARAQFHRAPVELPPHIIYIKSDTLYAL